MVCSIQQQQYRWQNGAFRLSISYHVNNGTVNLNLSLLRSIFQFMGYTQVSFEYSLALLLASYRTFSTWQISRQRVQPRQHLESSRIICSHWYVVISTRLFYGA